MSEAIAVSLAAVYIYIYIYIYIYNSDLLRITKRLNI